MLLDRYKYNKECEDIMNEWENSLYSHLILHLPSNGGVKEEVFTSYLGKVLNKTIKSKRNFDESYLYLKYSKDSSDYQRKLFFDSPMVIAKNYNEFDGVFVVDVSDWISNVHSLEFKQLLDYVQKYSKIMRFVFVIAQTDKEKTSLLTEALLEVVNAKEVTMTYPDTEYFLIYLNVVLHLKGVSVNDDMRNKLIDLIEYYKQDDDFRGYDTMDKLMEDIVYLSKKNKDIDLSVLYKTRIKRNDKEGQYIGF